MVQLTGEDIALLGPRLSGKTTLYDFLTRVRPSDGVPEPTVGPKRTAAFRSKVLGLTVHKGFDLPGADFAYPDWERQFKKSSKIFYLFDAHKLRTDPVYADRVRLDGKKIKEWGIGDRRVMMLGTHSDTDPEHLAYGTASYTDLIMDHEVVVGFQTRAGVSASAVGSFRGGGDAIVALLERVLK
jgi:hypothetical protein